MITISDIVESIKEYSPDANLQPVMNAYLLAAQLHEGQFRKSGEPYLSHPLEVAQILTDMHMDVDTIGTALLHDALEDNPISKKEMEEMVGVVVTELVDGVTKIGKMRFRSEEELQAENFRKMMLATSKDLRVILVKLADRLHNMRTLEHHSHEKQLLISRETREIFVPIANRLGLTKLKSELADLCFRYLEPEEHRKLENFLEGTQKDREEYTERVVEALGDQIKTLNVSFRVSGRAKNISGIHKKILAQGLEPSEVSDILAFRVILQDIGDCYACLGLIHSVFPPMPGRIKDYIAQPKPNGYQSLHTTVIGPEKRRVEIQFRTEEMHRMAENGVSAHWKYKEGHLAIDPGEVLRIARIRDLFENARQTSDASDYMATLKSELYADEVFTFTPGGDIKRFPKGATVLDFAYAVHTDIGSRCVGAKVNGRMVNHRYTLASGDTVQILKGKNQKPRRDWLNKAKTSRALSKIRQSLRQEERAQGVRLGLDMVESELKRFGWTMQKAQSEGRINEMLKTKGRKDLDSLYVDVARGQVPLASVVREVLPEGLYDTRNKKSQPNAIGSFMKKWRSRPENPVLITGEDGLLVSFAKCCRPLPGEDVMGYVTRGKGITVHRLGCVRLSEMDEERQIPVEWDMESGSHHTGTVEIFLSDRPGMLANITKVCEQYQVDIQRADARKLPDDRAVCTLEITVVDIKDLTRLIRNIEKIKGVESVHRVTG